MPVLEKTSAVILKFTQVYHQCPTFCLNANWGGMTCPKIQCKWWESNH